ncbi:putative bifunctional diguanylate cyclase/phosphodiesterase [Sphingomonas glacialis]|uniref:EAL domain-containing protein n=1 Tax=Sphingomonas glacialis TaxID=658225 RepID=A0A502G1K6_9SPHN|nr:EAL domain-containing protein [Sphingomonas glacialis]TPG55146.1 EAL domain-containing protein [Sphingomonas glacialis]
MDEVTLKSRAVVFAMCAGAVAFFLAVLATSARGFDLDNIARALIPAVVCAAMCWASAERSIAGTAGAIDAAIARLARAGEGDLDSAIPAEIGEAVPQLARAMQGLFTQMTNNLDSVHRLAMFDPVTGLANRSNFRATCERMLAATPANGGESTGALFFIDLDRFKTVNDTMGHACGDALLGMVANRLRAVADGVAHAPAAAAPLIGRLAGDEFTMFFPAIGDPGEAAEVGHAVLRALAEPFELGGTHVSIGASIGMALCPDHGSTLADLMRAADAAMYHAKGNGRGRAEPFSVELAARIAERTTLEGDLREAIDRDEFALVFQPQISIEQGRVVGAEALLRWRHPREGLRLPLTFLDCAEETGMIVDIGDWVVESVAATIARWGRIGIEQRLAVNVSPRQIDHADFFHGLRAALRRASAPAHLLELEISETLAMQCSDAVLAAIEQLRADGATIAIDDFGTGYSNLSRLRALPIDRIKLDRSLVAHVADDTAARTIAQAVVGVIHALGCEAVAEGVETPAQVEILRIIGCDVMQGYAIAAPMEESAFVSWSRGSVRRAVGDAR